MQDRGLLGALSVDERTRLLAAAADVHNPDLVQRRRWAKALRRREKAERVGRDESVLADAGIRQLRSKPVFTTPDPPRPAVEQQTEVENDPDFREVVERQHCYVCKQRYVDDPPLLRPALSVLRATSTSRSAPRRPICAAASRCSPAGASRSATRPASNCCAQARSVIVTTRFPRDCGDALRTGAATSPSGATASRSSASICGTRRASRGSAAPAADARPPRLHRQQRVPDRASTAGLLPAHARARDGLAARTLPSTCAAARRLRGLRRYDMLPAAAPDRARSLDTGAA